MVLGVPDPDLGIPADRLFPTVHPDDQDALRIWREVIGIPDDRIGRLEDNWWGPVGATGEWSRFGDLFRPRPGAWLRHAGLCTWLRL